MILNHNFVKTDRNGEMDAIKFTKWHEPIICYPIQIMAAILLLISYFGAKFLISFTIFQRNTPEFDRVVKRKK